MRTAKPCGPGTRGWCQAERRFAKAQPGDASLNPSATVTRRIRRRGEHGISRKAIAQGMPECSDCTCMLVCAFLCASCTRDRGCSVHPAFPAPSVLKRDNVMQTLGRHAPREGEVMLANESGPGRRRPRIFPPALGPQRAGRAFAATKTPLVLRAALAEVTGVGVFA